MFGTRSLKLVTTSILWLQNKTIIKKKNLKPTPQYLKTQ